MKSRKLKKRKKIFILYLIIVVVIIVLLSFFGLSKIFKTSDSSTSKSLPEKIKSPKISEYVSSLGDSLIEEVELDKKIVSIFLKDNDKFSSIIFDYYTGEELSISDVLTDEEEFWDKVSELLYLKYPKFIAEVLSKHDQDNVYYLKDNELIIYYYNYEIKPIVNEQLFITVNYNEIKDYLDLKVNLDDTYQNEDGNVINKDKKLIAITFDDGPGPYTSNLVNTLKENKAKATFFMLGNRLNNYKTAVLDAYNGGMEIAYHSYAHTNFLRQSASTITNELNKSNEILESIIGIKFSIVRPPYGSINASVKSILNMPIIKWNVDTNDWMAQNKNADYLKNYILNTAKDGDIILLHDIHKTSVDAISIVLPELYARGYQVVTVSDLAASFEDTLENSVIYFNFIR